MLDGLRSQLARRFGDDRIRRVLHDAGLNTAATALSGVLNLVRNAVFARYLGVTDYGRFAVIVATCTLVRQVLSVRLWEWTSLELARALVAKDGPRGNGVARASLLLGLLINGLAALTTVCFTSLLVRDQSLVPLMRVYSAAMVVICFDDCSLAILRVTGKYRFLAGYTVATAVFRIAVIVPVILLAGGLRGVLISIAASQLVISGWLFLAARVSLREAFGRVSGGMGVVLSSWRSHLKTIGILSITDTVKTASSEGDQLLIDAMAGASSVGAYKAATNVVNGILGLSVPLYMVFHPEMTKLTAARDAVGLKRLIRQLALLGTAAGVAIAGLLIVTAPLLVRVLFGTKFASVTLDLQIMALAFLVMSVQWAPPLFVSLKKTHYALIMHSLALAVKAGTMALLVHRYGDRGAAIAFAAHSLTTVAASLVLGKKARTDIEKLDSVKLA